MILVAHTHSQLSGVDMTSSAEETHYKVELIHKEHVRIPTQ